MDSFSGFSGGFPVNGQLYDHNGQLHFHRDNGKTYPLAGSPHAPTHMAGGNDEILLNQLGAPNGSVEFNSQQALALRIENRTDDPVNPANGRIWARTDLAP